MKRLLSILVTLAIFGASVFVIPAQAATAADTTSADALAATLGATDANLIMSEGFDTDGVVPFTPTVTTSANLLEGTNVVTDGKWYIGAASNKDLAFTSGFTGKKLGDFIASFEFSPNRGWGNSQFYYHSTSGNGNAYTYRLVLKSGAGYASTFMLEKKGDTSESNTCSGPVFYDGKSWKVFNVVIVSKGNTDAAYIWEKGTEMPTTPTLQITTASKTTGDMYYYSYQDTAYIDDIKIYDLSTVSPENMRAATGLSLYENNLVYQNDLNAATEPPVGMFGAYVGGNFNGTSVISDGKWVTGGELGTSTGLGGNVLTDFAYGFQISSPDMVEGNYVHFVYHNNTGWGGAYGNTYVSMSMAGSNIVFGLAEQNSTAATTYKAGEIINVIITCKDGNLSTYVWKEGETIPTAPFLTYDGVTEQSGGMYFHTNGNFSFDNFYIYDLTDTELYAEDIAQAIGLSLDDDMLVYSNNFDNATEPPVTYFSAYDGDDYNASSTISDGKWVTGGTLGTNKGLTKLPYLKNFAFGFQFEPDSTAEKCDATFAYHTTTGWANVNPENRLQVGSKNGNLTFGLYANDGDGDTKVNTISSSVTSTLTLADKVNVIMTYVDGKVSAYIWKAGATVPTSPTLTVDAAVESSGDLYFTFFNNPFKLDNFYVYDLTSEDSDGVYTTMESSYQMESTFKGLPKTIETTIKMPTIFTGGAGNTIIGNHKYENYVFSFEINANGNPYVVFDPPWKQRRVIEFTEVDVRTGEWLNLAITTDIVADNVSCYVNGELKQTLDIPTHYDPVLEQNPDFLDYDIGSKMYIGRDIRGAYDKYYFKGKIKTLTMFSDIRTAEEIAADMAGVASDADALIADYCFDGCYGKGVADRSANSYDLINVGYMETDPEEPTDYAYSFAVVGDTQILTRVYPEKLSSIYDWIVENKEAHNIQYVMGLGDITDSDTDKEWALAASEISKLNGVVPYSLVRGNHDSEAKFNQYLADIYPSQIDGYYNSINNSYKIFTVGEVDYLLINLNMGAIDEELAWAEELIASHPNHNVIITTHIYLDSDGTKIDDYGTVPATKCRDNANNGDDIWNELISKYSNISLVMSGHVSCTEVLVTKSEGANGNIVTEMLIDPQSTDESYSAGPAGLVTMLYFSEDGKNVQVRNYSTVNDQYYGPQNQFNMTIDTVDYRYGDVNDDAEISVLDLVRLKKVVAKEDVSYNKRTSNINKDEIVDALDLTELRKILINKAS